MMGLDVITLPLCWGIAFTEWFAITAPDPEPYLSVMLSVWCLFLLCRLRRGLKEDNPFYRRHLIGLSLLITALAAVVHYLLLFRIGHTFLLYLGFPLLILGMGVCMHLFRVSFVRDMFFGIALAQASLAPVMYLSYLYSPVRMTRISWIYELGLLFFLCVRESNRKEGQKTVVLLELMPLLIVGACLFYQPDHINPSEEALRHSIAIAAACFFLFMRIRNRLPEETRQALLWPAMAIPALLALLILQ